jgi:hypothetical protein
MLLARAGLADLSAEVQRLAQEPASSRGCWFRLLARAPLRPAGTAPSASKEKRAYGRGVSDGRTCSHQ